MDFIDGVDKNLQEYITIKVFPRYKMNGESHGIEHIKAVIQRTFEIIKEFEESTELKQEINYNMTYVIAAYHDIGEYIDRKKHNIISGEMMFEDEKLDEFFSIEEKQTMKMAIEDHRASNEYIPRSIYGRIILTADRNNNLADFFKRRVQYCLERHPEFSLEEIQDEIWKSSKKKFGEKGYAKNKPGYMPSKKLEEYFKKLEEMLGDKEIFFENVKRVYEEQFEDKYKIDEIECDILKEIKIVENDLIKND